MFKFAHGLAQVLRWGTTIAFLGSGSLHREGAIPVSLALDDPARLRHSWAGLLGSRASLWRVLGLLRPRTDQLTELNNWAGVRRWAGLFCGQITFGVWVGLRFGKGIRRERRLMVVMGIGRSVCSTGQRVHTNDHISCGNGHYDVALRPTPPGCKPSSSRHLGVSGVWLRSEWHIVWFPVV